ncbi:MAG: PKD domain-containing protein [Bacteroidota bacterium]
MRKLLLFICVGMLWRVSIFGQCQTNINFNTWGQEGYAANGNWTVQGGGTSVFQTINGDPTFYVSPDTFINVQISGKIRIEDNTAFDDDFVGFVFGYREPDGIPNEYDLWLFDWKRETQNKDGGNYTAQEGFTLSRIVGTILAGNANYWPNFWAHDQTAATTPIATDYGSTKGWATFTDYNFVLLYTPTRATILVNNDTIFDEPGCYEPGRFGFYNYSQPNVRYSDFSYTLISNFEVENNDYDQCVSSPVKFLFTDSTCIGGTSLASNIATWDWDFGNGISSTQSNPIYTYNTPGNYDIQLIVTDVNGCQDSVTKTVVVHPPPTPIITSDSVFCPTDSIALMVSGGVDYVWQPSTGLSNPTIANPLAYPSSTTTYSVNITDQYGCQNDTSLLFHVFEATVNGPLVICEGDTTSLGASGGVQYAWSPGGVLNDPTLPNPLAYPTTTTTYQAIVTDIYGCEDTVFQTISVNPRPTITVGPDTTVCPNEPVTFMATGGLNYIWADDQANILGTGASITLSFPDSSWIYVVGTDINGCSNVDSVRLNITPPLIVDAGQDLSICSYETIAIGSQNNPVGTYSWNPGTNLDDPTSLMPVFDPSSDGVFVFTLTVTDQNGCMGSDQMSVTVHPFQLSEVNTPVLCFGDNTGGSIMTINGTAPYSYTWLDSLGNPVTQLSTTNPSASSDSLFAGNYLAIAVDSFGCTDTIPVQITEPSAPLDVSLSNLVNVDCFGNANGEFHVAASGGTPAYQYSIDGGFNFNGTGSFTGLGAAIYTVLVRDANLCTTSLTDTIRTPTGLFAEITTLRHIDCFGANNGAFALVGQGGAPPYQYSLDNVTFSPNLSVSNLAPGRDTVFFFDNNGCQVTLPFEIFEPTPLLSSITDIKGIDCFGNNNGQIWITSNGGTLPHQFSLDGINFQADSTFPNLPGGTDTLIVQDDSLCQVSIPFTITEPALLSTSILSQRNVDCFGNASGELIFSTNGGIPAYQFSLDSMNFQSDSAFANLIAGSYTVTVVDDSSCISQVSVDITEPPALELSNALQSNVDCFGNNSGFVLLDGEGGTSPYQFSLDLLNFQSDSLFVGLTAGDYSFFVVDDSSCVDSISVSITEPDLLQLVIAEQVDVDCFGNDNGSLLLSGLGGVSPYLFGLDNGPLQADSSFGPLTPGTHQVRLQDDSLCMTLLEVNILEPPLLEISAMSTDVTCFGFDNGTGTVEITGGSPEFVIEWDSPSPQNTQTATGLGPGSYQVIVSDLNGCMETASIDVFEPDTLELTIVDGSFVEAFCNWENGEAAVEAVGGIEPYVFRWEGPGFRDGPVATQLFGDTTYTAIVTDSNGCETAIPVFIPQTPPATPMFLTDPTFEDSILFSQANVQFLNQSIGAVAYSWDFGDGDLSDEEHPMHQFTDTRVYAVTLTTYNKYFVCPTDTTILLHIIPDGSLYVPNAFSPNNDGYNDFFYPMGEGLIDYEMIIFDRWGRKIAVLSQLEAHWDGRSSSGQALPEGVYVYRVTAHMNNGATVDRGGTVTLLR